MLEKVKTALRLRNSHFDEEINSLIDSAKADLHIAGVVNLDGDDMLVERAIITYCTMNFYSGDYERLKKCYDEQKAQLSMSSCYTDFGD